MIQDKDRCHFIEPIYENRGGQESLTKTRDMQSQYVPALLQISGPPARS